MDRISKSASGLLTVSQLAGELDITQLGARRLIARGRIAHYVQSDGSAMIEPTALADYYRRGSPDLHGPKISGEWIDGTDLDLLDRQSRQQCMSAITDELPEDDCAGLPGKVRPGPAAMRLMKQPFTRHGRAGEHPSRDRLEYALDPILAVSLRRSALNIIRRGGHSGGMTAIDKLYASRAQYQRITIDAKVAMLRKALLTFKRGRQSIILPTFEVMNAGDFERIAYIAF